MNELEYSQLAGHITEKLDNTAEYEDWLTIQDYVDELQSNLTKEQLAYINLRDTFNKLQQENTEKENINLKQALNEIKDICYGSDMSKQEYDKVLQIIDKVLGDGK